MKLKKVFSCGVVKDAKVYSALKTLDGKNFPGCGDEFLANRDWWVVIRDSKIVGYCGCLYSEGVCVFVRAWVHRDYRGQGWQCTMIKQRLLAARQKRCSDVVTYTTPDNFPSANNLIRCGFLLHNPVYAYAGTKMLYFKKTL